jgi:hypothetical protein
VLLGTLLMLVVTTALLSIVHITYRWQETAMSQNGADTSAREALDRLIDNVRSAQNNPTASYAVLSAASANSLTLYQSYYNYGNSPPTQDFYTIQYWVNTSVSPNVLEQTTVKDGVTTTVPVAQGVTSLTLTYYKTAGTYSAASSGWVTTANPNSPTTAELLLIGAIQVQATITTWDGFTRSMTSMVRLMNSPYQANGNN